LHATAEQGTNNRGKFYVLWVLTKTAKEKGQKHLQVYEDSKLMMDWANSRCRIDNILLAPIMNPVLEVKQHFDDISFVHI
jgi:hypothetical protein